MRVGQARKRDANEGAIVQALERHGAVVRRLSGKDLPDLLIQHRGRWLVAEVKTATGKPTAGQAQAAYPIVRSVDEAIALLMEIR